MHRGVGADQAGRAGQVHRLQERRAPDDLSGMAAGAGEQHRQGQANAAGVEARLLLAQQRLQFVHPPVLLRLRHLPGVASRRCARARGVFEAERLREADRAHQRQRVGEVGRGLARVPDDEVRGQRQIGPRRAQPFDQLQIVGGRVPAVHCGKDPIGPRLYRQVQEGHQHRQIAMRCDQIVIHVARVRGGVAQPSHAGDLGHRAQQPPQPPSAPPQISQGPPQGAILRAPLNANIRRGAVPRIDVLAQQHNLARPLQGKLACLCKYRLRRAAHLRPARVRHDAEAAEFVAALLDRQESAEALRHRRLRQEVEFLFRREIGVDDRAGVPPIHSPRGAGHHLRQSMIGLRPQHDVDERRSRQDLRPLGLRDTTRHRQDHPPASRRARLLDQPQPAEFGKHLLRRAVANVAGVENDHVGVVRRPHRDIPQRRQHIRHSPAVIHVHLATPGDDVQTLGAHPLRSVHRRRSARPRRKDPTRGAEGIIGIQGRVKRKSAWEPPSTWRNLAGNARVMSTG